MSWDRGYHPIADTRALEVPPPQRGARVSPARRLPKQAPRFLIGHDPADKRVPPGGMPRHCYAWAFPPEQTVKSSSARLARERGPIVQDTIPHNSGVVK